MKYSKILKQDDQGRRQLWYIFGKEQALVQDALELAKDHVRSGSTSIARSIYLGEDVVVSELCLRLSQDTSEERSMVVLLNADAFKEWDILIPVLQRLEKSHFFIAVSNKGTVNSEEPYIRLFMGSSKVRLVECNKFSNEDLMEWMTTRLYIRQEACLYLIKRSRGDYEWLLNTIRKLQYMEGVVTLSLVEKLFKDTGIPNLADSLLKYRKRDAIIAVRNNGFDQTDTHKLYRAVRKAALLREALNTVGYLTRNLIERTKLTQNEIALYRPLTKKYDPKTVTRLFILMLKLYPKLEAQDKWSWETFIFKW